MLGRTRLSFRRGRWKICVAGPCGDAFVCVGLSEEMSHRAAQAFRAVLRARPRAGAAGRTNMVDTFRKKKEKETPTQACTLIHAFFHLHLGAHAGTCTSDDEGQEWVSHYAESILKTS